VSPTEVRIAFTSPGGAWLGNLVFNPMERFETATLECRSGTSTVRLDDPACARFTGGGGSCARGACSP
jgi:hypothetical protein